MGHESTESRYQRDGAEYTYLTDLSEGDKPWDRHRSEADNVAGLYGRWQPSRLHKGKPVKPPGFKIANCSYELRFNYADSKSDTGVMKLKLQTADFCRCRLCPICQWRRSLKWTARCLQALPSILTAEPKLRFIYLTLTVRNCEVDDLRDTIQAMNKAWHRLTNRKVWPGVGFIKSIEVTRNSQDGTVHPHIHALVAVRPGYFTGAGYIKQEKWRELWQKSIQVNYLPVVNVKVIKPRHAVDSDKWFESIKDRIEPDDYEFLLGNELGKQYAALSAAIVETVKYSVKPGDLVGGYGGEGIPDKADSDFLITLTEQLQNLRTVSLGGIFKEHMAEVDDEDLVHITGEEDDPNRLLDPVIFTWIQAIKRYVIPVS